MKSIEAFCQDLVKCKQCRRIVTLQEGVHKREAVLIVQHIEVAQHILILHVSTAERHSLVKDGQCITHRSVSLVSYHVERFVIDCHTLA